MTQPLKLPPSFSLVELQTVGSTNDHAKTLARNGYPHGTVVWAHEQTAGRGRHGNTWTALSGNLYMSVILRPELNAALTGQLSFVAAVALAWTLKDILPSSASLGLKWPNDVLLNGKKAAGILLETELNGVRPVNWIVVGVGVNVAAAPEGAVSLADFGVRTDSGAVLEKFLSRLKGFYGGWLEDGFEPVRAEWLKYATGLGEKINVRLARETFTGTFLGLDRTGALEVACDNGEKRIITSGEVYL